LDNYLKISNKIYNMRVFLERSQGDMFERKMYLTFLKLEDDLGITQCINCSDYDFIGKLNEVDNLYGGVDMICDACLRIKNRRW
jgi:hypothetical protein